MSWFKKKIKVAVHDGSFHADEVFACATLFLWADKNGYSLNIIRTRDRKIIEEADIVADVGFVYDPERGRFDHHQKGGAGVRGNGIPYASFGLVWRKYGGQICGSTEIADMVEGTIVMPIDARDNGINISVNNELGIADHRTSNAVSSFNPTWQEDLSTSNEQFKKALDFAKEILDREIVLTKAEFEGARLTKEAILSQNTPEILILNKYFNWEKTVSCFSNIKFVVHQHKNGKDWCVQVGRDNLEDYNSNRAKLPENWGGLGNSEAEKASGIKGVVFCAKGGWFGVAKTKKSAFEMAQKALQNSVN